LGRGVKVRFARIQPLLKEGEFKKIENAKILLLGVGGVGGVCLDCLFRSGVRDITIVDFDSFDETNQNRQLYSELYEDEIKTQALQKHYKTIKIIEKRVDAEWVESFDFTSYDLILDAIDDRGAKIALAIKCYKKLISSFGSAKRMDPTKVEVSDIWKSYGDKFGSKIRYELRKQGFTKKYKVVFSSEEVLTKEMGSFMGVTATFGLVMCAEALKYIKK
jgi:tRNA A37 threonylcarbamoyladenosine dehydratase